jgi:hypothetical protein
MAKTAKQPDDNVVHADFGKPKIGPNAPASKPEFNREDWFSVGELAKRGWARQWMNMGLGEPLKHGGALLWPRRKALAFESHPAFAVARAALDEIARRARFVTKSDEVSVLQEAWGNWKAAGRPAAEKVEIAPVVVNSPAPSAWPQMEQTPDAITLTWPEGKVVVPVPFLDALRKGMGETSQRLSFAISTIVTDWQAGHVKPTQMNYGRNYFLASVRNVLRKLQELERGEPNEATEPPSVEPSNRVLH